jgi:hypothetical protein
MDVIGEPDGVTHGERHRQGTQKNRWDANGVEGRRTQMSRVASTLWAIGGMTTWLSVVLPHPVGYRPAGLATVGMPALLATAGC